MSKLIMSAYRRGIPIDYYCKSIRTKYKGRKCKEFGTAECMTCDLCQAVIPASDVNRLLYDEAPFQIPTYIIDSVLGEDG